MTDARWMEVERIYHAALEHPACDRAAFVQKEAGGDAGLIAEVAALLSYDDKPAAFMDHSAMELAARALASDPRQCEPAEHGTIGSYEIVRCLGAGGMGDVYLARDVRLARKVALKVLRPDLADPRWIAAFRQEALAASALNHPNIVTIFEIGESEGTRFIATEYVDGVTLRERLRQKPIAATELVDIALKIAEGLAAAHEAGVVHRDIKPDNVMLRADGLVKIVDFGIAMRPGSDVVAALPGANGPGAVVIGTTGYMSPEQQQGLAVDARTDVWSLGIVMYEMATGHLPSSDPPTRNHRANRLPELARIIDRARSPERTNRYATAAELARDLRALRRILEDPSSGDVVSRQSLWLGVAAFIFIAITTYLVIVAGRRGDDTLVITSISVMPIENVGDIREGEYLADGIASSLRSGLAQFSSIRQAAPSEAARYRRLGVSPAQAGQEMRVTAVLTGTLERNAETAIVRLVLLRSADGIELWKRQFVRPVDDLLTLQTEVARDLAEALNASPRRPLNVTSDTANPAAYQLYVKGRYHVLRRTPADLRKGLEYLREAVMLDPGYARAHARLADAHILLAMTSDVAPKTAFPQARTAAERALAIDPELSEARVSMGIIKFWYDWDWSGAEAEFKRAIAATPPDPAAHTFYGHLLSNLGDHTRALQEMRRALDYEPHSALANALFAQCMYYEGRYDEALAHLQKTRDLDPGLWVTYNMMGRIYGLKRMDREALQAFKTATDLGASLVVTANAGFTLAAAGRPDEARKILDELKTRASQGYVPPSNLALVHLGLGENSRALDRLEEAVEARDVLLTFLTVEPRWAGLAAHPRFAAVLRRVGLKQ